MPELGLGQVPSRAGRDRSRWGTKSESSPESGRCGILRERCVFFAAANVGMAAPISNAHTDRVFGYMAAKVTQARFSCLSPFTCSAFRLRRLRSGSQLL